MRRNGLYMTLVLLAGAGGAVLRGMSLLYGYDDAGLPVTGYLPATALAVLTAVAVVCFAVLGRVWFAKADSRSFEQLFCGMSGGVSALCMLLAVCSALLCGVGLLTLSAQVAEQNSEYVQIGMVAVAGLALVWVLGIAADVCMLLLANGQRRRGAATKALGMFATLPMFWCCLELIMVYHENSGNPVTSDYSYLLLLIIAVMTVFYSMGGFLFSEKGSPARFFAASGIAVYLVCTHVGGELIRCVLSDEPNPLLYMVGTGDAVRVGVYLCVGLYILVQLGHAASRVSGQNE